MKVVLSRKGFDSSNGGIPSPIFPDGTLVSFPIPSRDRDQYCELFHEKIPYTQIFEDLNYKGEGFCHLDPDLDQRRRGKPVENWKPAFGQINAAATYLKNIGIGEGDLFLFFGNFHHVGRDDKGHFHYLKGTGDFYLDHDVHLIWGYLQVGRVIDHPAEQEKLWWHPHASRERTENSTNVIFEGAQTLSFAKGKPGAGLLTYDRKRVLTLPYSPKATWRRNEVYDPEHILGKRRNSAKSPQEGIYYAGIWQELGLMESLECSRWASSMIL